MLAGIRDFVVISTPEDKVVFQNLLWDAKERMGINIQFLVQHYPRGIADAFNIVAEDLWDIKNQYDKFALILGDNIFYGAGLTQILREALVNPNPSCFVQKVEDPERFGVVNFNERGEVVDLEEKPKAPKSNFAVTGLYFLNHDVFDRVRSLKPSKRNELEITDILNQYCAEKRLNVVKLLRGTMWFDTGTADSLMEAANMIRGIQKHHGFMVGNPHEIAYNSGWIDKESLKMTAHLCEKSAYGKYLFEMLESK